MSSSTITIGSSTARRFGRDFVPLSGSMIEGRLAVAELRSKYLAIKTSLEAIPDPQVVVDYIHAPRDQFGLGQPEAAVCWANHPAESGGHPHTHYVVRFPSQVYWGAIRSKLKDLGDDHAYSDVGRSWTRSVRYLLHLDNPEKEPIPRENFKFSGLDISELKCSLVPLVRRF